MKKNLKIIILLTSILLTSCRDKSEYLIGAWREVPFTNPDEVTKKITWKFYAGDALEIIVDYTDPKINDTTIKYTYTLAGKKLSIYNEDTPYYPGLKDPRGDYWVDVLKKKQLKVTKKAHPGGEKGGAFQRKEFIKE